MKKLQILKFCISLLFCFLFLEFYAQQPVNSKRTKATLTQKGDTSKYNAPFFNGVLIGVNIADPILKAFGQDYGSYEATVECNIHNRFLPELSLGIGSANSSSEVDFTYKTKGAQYGRIGMNYNFFYNNKSPNFIIVGLRYGFASYKADISNLFYNNGYWEQTGPYEILNQKFRSHWLEFGAGVRVQVYKNLYMGWMAYFKPLLKEGNTPEAAPWYIPGYGVNGKGFGFNYNVYYQLPIKKRKR